jgi:hypothetical protein
MNAMTTMAALHLAHVSASTCNTRFRSLAHPMRRGRTAWPPGDLKTILQNFEKGEEAFFFKLYSLKAHELQKGRVGINTEDCRGRAVDLLKVAMEEMRRRM